MPTGTGSLLLPPENKTVPLGFVEGLTTDPHAAKTIFGFRDEEYLRSKSSLFVAKI